VNQKRILIVANATWNIYKFRLNIIKRLLENDFKVFVASPIDEFIGYKELFPTVIHIDLKRLKRDHTHPINDVLSIFELKRIYKSISPNIILHYTHKANIYGGIASWLSNHKSIAVVTGLGYPFLHKGPVQIITRLLYKMIKRVHSKIVFENEDDRNYFVASKLAVNEKAIFINGCGIDTDEYEPKLTKAQSSKTVFTFIGRLLKDKGIGEYLLASSIIRNLRKDVEFRVIGEFDDGNPSMISKIELNHHIENNSVKYIDFVDDVKPYISQSDCIVLPSYREGMPRVILEALSMAKPVITTDVPGCRQTVDDGVNGILVKHMDVDSLVKGIEYFLSLNDEKVLKMGIKGREKAIKQFNSEKISSELYEIISQVYFCS